jgi:PTS system nitrogen regulatory IIA component
MQLTVSDVAQLCDVGENRVFKWVQEEGLPAEQVNGSYRVNPAELLEWATNRKLHVSPTIFQKMNGDSVSQTGLSDALANGGVIHDVAGNDRQSILSALLETLPLPPGFDRGSLVQLLMAREMMGGTAMGDGIAIPHPRSPVVLPGAERVVRLGFLKEPIDFGAPDGKPIDTLFLMICPTVRDHLQQLARLASVLRDESFRQSLRDKPSQDAIVKEVRRIEELFHGST